MQVGKAVFEGVDHKPHIGPSDNLHNLIFRELVGALGLRRKNILDRANGAFVEPVGIFPEHLLNRTPVYNHDKKTVDTTVLGGILFIKIEISSIKITTVNK